VEEEDLKSRREERLGHQKEIAIGRGKYGFGEKGNEISRNESAKARKVVHYKCTASYDEPGKN